MGLTRDWVSSQAPKYPRRAWIVWASPNTPHAVAAGDLIVGLRKLIIPVVLSGRPESRVSYLSKLMVPAP